MKNILTAAFLLAAFACAAPGLCAETAMPVPARAEIKLHEGINDIKLAGKTIKIIKGYVFTGTAHSYSTFSVYVPGVQRDYWLQALLDDKATDGMVMRNSEAAETSVRTVAFYKLDGHLYAVQATKTGLKAPELYNDKASVELRVSRFDENWEVPSFTRTSLRQTKDKYADAVTALEKEFFSNQAP